MSIFFILILAIIFISLIVLIIKNRQKIWAQGIVLAGSIASFITSIYLYSHGNSVNSSFDSQLESLFETGKTNPRKCLYRYIIIFCITWSSSFSYLSCFCI